MAGYCLLGSSGSGIVVSSLLACPAVIPSLSVFGPLALLAAVFPAVFGGLALWLKRWSYLLTAASVMSTLDALHRYFGGHFHGAWWSREAGLWTMLGLTAGLFPVAAVSR